MALRLAHEELDARFSSLEHEYNVLRKDLTESQKLNAQLEEQIMKLNNMSGSVVGSIRGFRSSTSPTSSIIGRSGPAFSTTAESDSAASLLPIVMQQRDRLRTRCTTLETDLSEANVKIELLRRDMTRLESNSKRQPFEIFTPRRDIEIGSWRRSSSSGFGSSLHSRMHPVERALVSIVRAAVQHKIGRWILLFYGLAIHVFVVTCILHQHPSS